MKILIRGLRNDDFEKFIINPRTNPSWNYSDLAESSGFDENSDLTGFVIFGIDINSELFLNFATIC